MCTCVYSLSINCRIGLLDQIIYILRVFDVHSYFFFWNTNSFAFPPVVFENGEFPGDLVVRHFTTLAQVQSLFGELRFCKLCGTVKKKVFPGVGMLNIFFFLHPLLYFVLLFLLCSSDWQKCYISCLYVFISKVEYLFICLLAICISFVNLCHFSIFLLK